MCHTTWNRLSSQVFCPFINTGVAISTRQQSPHQFQTNIQSSRQTCRSDSQTSKPLPPLCPLINPQRHTLPLARKRANPDIINLDRTGLPAKDIRPYLAFVLKSDKHALLVWPGITHYACEALWFLWDASAYPACAQLENILEDTDLAELEDC